MVLSPQGVKLAGLEIIRATLFNRTFYDKLTEASGVQSTRFLAVFGLTRCVCLSRI